MLIYPPGDGFFRGKIGRNVESWIPQRFQDCVLYFVLPLVVQEDGHEVEVDDLDQFPGENSKQFPGIAIHIDGAGYPKKGLVPRGK